LWRLSKFLEGMDEMRERQAALAGYLE
jgi:hypothetical protein